MATGSTVITGGLVLASGASHAAPADLLLHDDLIVAITPPGEVTSESAQRIDAANRLIIPGLINAHTHSHGGLAKGAGDRWSLELLLNAGPWLNGGRTDDDRSPPRSNCIFPVLSQSPWPWSGRSTDCYAAWSSARDFQL
jgi:guanine deaminase